MAQMACPNALRFYRSSLKVLSGAGIPFVVGGAFALKHYSGLVRTTKDLDIFLRRQDLARALSALETRGFLTQTPFPHWLAKAHWSDHFVDLIFSSANGLCPVDDAWFSHATPSELFGVPVKLCPIEEVIWTKSFVMERERFDGADVCHLIMAMGERIDWRRLLARFGENWHVLLGHLVFCDFIFPRDRQVIPNWIMDELTKRLRESHRAEDVPVCRGTLVSREQYLVDLRERGYDDARLPPWGRVAPDDIQLWTDAIGKEI